jgi:MFS transporter, PPP family, 3-phenylpropionic acid transporter
VSAQPDQRPWALISFYVLYFGTVGVSLPFMPGYFKTLGFSGAESGALLAIGPLFSLVMPPLWGQLTDRTGRPGLVLFVTTTGGALGYGLLAHATTFSEALLALSLHATFASSLSSLADTLALHHVQHHGGSYARVRIWGSIGFVLVSLPFGFLITELDRTTVLVPLVLLSLAALSVALTHFRRALRRARGAPALRGRLGDGAAPRAGDLARGRPRKSCAVCMR